MKIYTKTGDKGQTSLVGGTRIPKTHERLEAYGTVDELNAFIGLLIEETADVHDREILTAIQSGLFSVGCYLATDPETVRTKSNCHIESEAIQLLESEIDRMDAGLPPLRHFVLPGGCKSAAWAHVCRTVARRAERHIYRIAALTEMDANVLMFINRLSDYFFVLARKECFFHGVDEKIW